MKHTGISKNKMPLRRHHDDDYWDEIAIDAGRAHLRAFVVPRYKTSGLSGDEWRIHAELAVTDDSTGRTEGRPYHSMRALTEYSAHFVFSTSKNLLLTRKPAVMVVKRKGHVLMRQKFKTFGDAAMGIGWHIVTANEGAPGVKWHHLTTEQELARCQQVGCSAKPRNFYRLKKLQVTPSDSLMVEPKYDFEGQFVWYCPRHTCRGDAGLEDCDKNLVLVKGAGKKAVQHDDEAPAAFGGAIVLDAIDDLPVALDTMRRRRK